MVLDECKKPNYSRNPKKREQPVLYPIYDIFAPSERERQSEDYIENNMKAFVTFATSQNFVDQILSESIMKIIKNISFLEALEDFKDISLQYIQEHKSEEISYQKRYLDIYIYEARHNFPSKSCIYWYTMETY